MRADRFLKGASVRWAATLSIFALATLCTAEKYAVLIGVNVYSDSVIPTLNCAAADAREIAKTLVESDGFLPANVHVLTAEHRGNESKVPESEMPTSQNIGAQLDWLTTVAKPGDTVFFFFAGHGLQFEDQAWLVPVNANIHGKYVFKHSAVPAEEIRKAFEKIPCLLVSAFDMCRTQKDSWVDTPSRGFRLGFRLGQLQERSIVTVHPAKADHPFSSESVSIFACQPGQFSWESHDLGRGFFSKCLQEALSYSADSNGSLTIREIVDRLHDNVLASVGAYGLSEAQEPDAFPSNDSVYRRVFANGLKPRTGDAKAGSGTPKRSASDLTSRDADDGYLESFQTGFRLYKRKQYREAQSEFEKTVAIRRTPAVLRILGDCRYKLNDKVAAREFFNQSIAQDPKYSPAYSDLGYMEDYDAKDFKKAEEFYQLAIKCDPGNPAPENNLARVMEDLHRPEECLRLYLKAVDLDPNSGLFEANLALQYHNMRNDAEAIKHAQMAKALGLEEHKVFELLKL